MRVKNFLAHFWLVFTDLVASTPVAIADPLRLPRKPPPPSKTPSNPHASTPPPLSCNLVVPTVKSWEDNKDDIGEFARTHWLRYLEDSSYKTFPLYLRDHFARDLAPSSLFCDTVGACGFSCQALNPELSQHDKQMAYYVFEQIAGVDHLFKSQRIGMQEAASYIDGKIPELIRTYSAAPRIERQLQKKLDDRRRNEKLGMAVGSALLMLAGGAIAVPGVLGLEETIVVPLTNMMTNTYISIVGMINAAPRDPRHLTFDVEENIRGSLNEFRHIMLSNLTYDMKSFMEGDKNHLEQDLIGILEGDYFFRRDENIQPAIWRMSEEMMFSSVLNGLWAQERSYIVWSDAPFRGCQYDSRGPSENRVCLDEDPKSVYYLYSLDVSREYDSFTNDKALIHGPTGYRNFIEGQRDTTYGLTKEDIVRSSIFVHEHKLQNAIEDLDYRAVSSALERGKDLGKNYGKFPGTYRLPISRNPGGEAISSVWSKKARNYPCMSGEFGWNDGTWSLEKDETFDFLVQTGLMFSEDWEDFCSHNGHCKGDNDIDWHSRFEGLRKEGDPKIPKGLKHPFKKCKQKTEHGVGEPWRDFDENPPLR
jgi:hypothetical protein